MAEIVSPNDSESKDSKDILSQQVLSSSDNAELASSPVKMLESVKIILSLLKSTEKSILNALKMIIKSKNAQYPLFLFRTLKLIQMVQYLFLQLLIVSFLRVGKLIR